MKKSSKAWLTGFSLLSLVAAVGFMAFLARPRIHSPVTLEFIHGHQVKTVLWRYAEEHGGTYPKSLADLDLGSVPAKARHFRDPRNGKEEDWVYYSGFRSDSPPATIILASPQRVYSDKRIVFFADGSGLILEESRVIEQLSRQVDSK